MKRHHIWVDAIFGTGLNADVTGYYRKVIEFVNRLTKPVFSVDIPSGLNADTGQPCGVCIRAHTTATFAFAKIGHYLHPGITYTGRLEVVDIGIPPTVAEKKKLRHFVITSDALSRTIKPRPQDAHKGNTGHLLMIAGSPGKTGAAAMAAMAAMRSGAGLVTVGIPETLNPIMETLMLEAMTVPLTATSRETLSTTAYEPIMALAETKNCLALGPGLGIDPETCELVRKIVLSSRVPLVIDADGLNCLAGDVGILKRCKVPVVLTPHPGEMSRLTGKTTAEIQADRVAHARKLAMSCRVHLVLKGAGSVIAHPDGRVYINTSGNAGMAAGGMGDILTGIVAGLMTQGYSPADAACLGAYLHGTAADTLAASYGPIGFLASDVMHAIPPELARLLAVRTEKTDAS
jgi:NAD(P)H-hydrate epimerase